MFKFKKVASIFASAIMLGSTVGLAAATTYPAPFVEGGSADVALVWGTNAANTDLAAVVDITNDLNGFVTSSSVTTEATIVGEAAPLFSGGSKLYVNDSLNNVKSILTKSNLPTVLADESFSGIVDASMTQAIEIGSHPRLLFSKQPTSSDDPGLGYTLSTDTGNYLYNATVTFSKTVDFHNSSSEGEEITMFGQTFTVASATTSTDLVLLKEAEKVALTSDDPSAEVTVAGETYTIELVSASDDAATIKVTDSTGASQSREINQDDSKKVQGLTVAVTTADETNLQLSATVIAGAEKVTLKSGSTVKVGEDDSSVKGTKVMFTGGGSNAAGLTKIIISVSAPDTSSDALMNGEAFVDPVFGSFKFDFSGLNIPLDSTSRESITVAGVSDDQLGVTFTNWDGKTETIPYAANNSALALKIDDDGRNLTVAERQVIKPMEYVIVGNEEEGYILELTTVYNDSTGTDSDEVEFSDVISGATYDTTWTSDGVGTVDIGGRTYNVQIDGDSNLGSGDNDYNVSLDYPDSSGANAMVAFPTIQTEGGALIAFYEPLTITLNGWDDVYQQGTHVNNLTTISIPDGDGYGTITIGTLPVAGGNVTVTVGAGSATSVNTSTQASSGSNTYASGAIGQLTWNVTQATPPVITNAQNHTVKLYLTKPTGGNIVDPALIIWEEQDDNNEYHAIVALTGSGQDSDDGIDVSDAERTFDSDNTIWEHSLASDSKMQHDIDLWGSLIKTDTSDSGQSHVEILYPEEQVYAMVYVAEEGASITGGGTTSGGSANIVSISDAEIGSAADRHLIVVGGSCINTVAADLLGSATPMCGADFTATTTAGTGQYLIETFDRGNGKVATLVAGYNAGDTTNAATYLTTQTVDTTAEMKYVGTSATSAELVTETTE